MKTQTIFVIVGKVVRQASATIRSGGMAVIATPHGPVEFARGKWYQAERAAKLAATKKFNEAQRRKHDANKQGS